MHGGICFISAWRDAGFAMAAWSLQPAPSEPPAVRHSTSPTRSLQARMLQVTFNLREVGRACKFLSNYTIYLWNCEHEAEYLLCGYSENEGRGRRVLRPGGRTARGL